ncbi:MAG: O-antigen ligase family protein [bacterium]|nr:O-antigen ligase family protein [bacterium]
MFDKLRIPVSETNPLLRVWVSLCIGFPAIAMVSIAGANLLLPLTILGFFFLPHTFSFPKNHLLWSILLGFIGWSLLTTAISPYGAHWGSWFEELSTILAILPGIIVGSSLTRIQRSYRIVAVVLLLVAGYAVWQFFFGWDIVRGWQPLRFQFHRYHAVGLQDFHLTYAGVIAVCLPLAAAVWSTAIGSFVAVSGVAAVMATMARSMMGAMGVSAILLGILGKKKLRILAVTIIVALLVLPQTVFQAAGERFARGVAINSEKAGEGDPTRRYLWLTSLAIIKDHPIAGVGNNRWDEAFFTYKIPFDGYSSTAHPHNDFLSTAVEYGIPGALIFATFWFAFLILLVKRPTDEPNEMREYRIAGLAGILTILIGGLVQCYLTDAEVSLQVWFLTGTLISMISTQQMVMIRSDNR